MANSSILDINDILRGYGDDIQTLIQDEAVKIAKDGVKVLKSSSPKSKRASANRGRYAKGWSVKKEVKRGEVHCIIHNRTDYQLTHLLEKGHLKRNGGFVKPITHIKPVEEQCISEYVKNVTDAIGKVGK
jgi:hypothetical protein